MSAIFPSVISSFFTQNKGGGGGTRAPPLDPPLFLLSHHTSPTEEIISKIHHPQEIPISCGWNMDPKFSTTAQYYDH